MPRSEADTWDLATSVGATATMVAAARALATREPDALIDDPYADALVRAVGIEFLVKLLDGEIPSGDDGDGGAAALMTVMMAVRTRFFDDFFVDACASGARQAVILASGLDSRAYRLPWPDGTVVYELDRPEVIDAKSATMADIGATPTCDRRSVAADLREDWPAALRRSGFDASAPTAWSAEGLLVYLPPEAQDHLFDDVTALSAVGSRLATEYHVDGGAGLRARTAAMRQAWGAHGFGVDFEDLTYSGERRPVVDYLSERGWRVSARIKPEVFAHYGRDFPDSELISSMRNSFSVTAVKS